MAIMVVKWMDEKLFHGPDFIAKERYKNIKTHYILSSVANHLETLSIL